jgi:hypothetical protein
MRTAIALCSSAHSARCASTADRTAALATEKATQNAPSTLRKVVPPCRVITSCSSASCCASAGAPRAAPCSMAVSRKVSVRKGDGPTVWARESSPICPMKR